MKFPLKVKRNDLKKKAQKYENDTLVHDPCQAVTAWPVKLTAKNDIDSFGPFREYKPMKMMQIQS